MRIGIYGRGSGKGTERVVEKLRSGLDASVVLEETTADLLGVSGVPIDRLADTDLIVSVGGDGTLLTAARAAGTTPVIGVNLGEVGFLNAVSPAEAVPAVTETLEALDRGDAVVGELPRLLARGDDWTLPAAINEVVVQGAARGPGGGGTIDVSVDGSQYSTGRADGVLIATPTGSTAYNLSEGGPIVHPAVAGLVITGMVSSSTMPSLVVDEDATIELEFRDAESGYAVVDGRIDRALSPPASITVTVAEQPVRLAGPDPDFYEALGKLDERFEAHDDPE